MKTVDEIIDKYIKIKYFDQSPTAYDFLKEELISKLINLVGVIDFINSEKK